ncbi:hypothetical protein DMUE_2216 [Dictyocoela muelleri]|nr:hypothetical protein DMUE_2216 [Dictyocoela muelleri]
MFFLLKIIICYQFRLKLKDTDLYIGGKDIYKPTVTFQQKGDIFIFEKSPDPSINYIVVQNKENRVFDIGVPYTYLSYYPSRHSMSNQKFKIGLYVDGSYRIYVMDGCVTYKEDSKIFEKVKCDANDKNQFFDVEPLPKVVKKDKVLQWSPHANLFDTRENLAFFILNADNNRKLKRIISNRNVSRVLSHISDF